MAKVKLSGIIQSISGKFGDIVFARDRGMTKIRPWVIPKNPKTKRQKQVRNNFGYISHRWKELSFIDKALWEDYAKGICKRKVTIAPIIRSYPPNPIDGRGAFISVNLLLLVSGFKPIEKPPVNALKPPTPLWDLKHLGSYNIPLKFNIKLPYQFKHKTVAQIWLKKIGIDGTRHLWNVIPITENETQVIINKLKVTHKEKRVERELKNLTPCVLKIQMRTIAENGKASIPSPLYKIDIR